MIDVLIEYAAYNRWGGGYRLWMMRTTTARAPRAFTIGKALTEPDIIISDQLLTALAALPYWMLFWYSDHYDRLWRGIIDGHYSSPWLNNSIVANYSDWWWCCWFLGYTVFFLLGDRPLLLAASRARAWQNIVIIICILDPVLLMVSQQWDGVCDHYNPKILWLMGVKGGGYSITTIPIYCVLLLKRGPQFCYCWDPDKDDYQYW